MMCDGESKSIPLKNFYKFTHINKDVQNKLIECTTVDSFVQLSIELAKSNGFYFSEQEMKESIPPYRSNELPVFDTKGWEGYEWPKKIIDVGWAPLGYSRT